MWAADPREVPALLSWPDALIVSVGLPEAEPLALARVARLLRDGLRVAVLLADGIDAHAVQIARRSGCTVLAGTRAAAALVRFVGLGSHAARVVPLGRPGCA